MNNPILRCEWDEQGWEWGWGGVLGKGRQITLLTKLGTIFSFIQEEQF